MYFHGKKNQFGMVIRNFFEIWLIFVNVICIIWWKSLFFHFIHITMRKTREKMHWHLGKSPANCENVRCIYIGNKPNNKCEKVNGKLQTSNSITYSWKRRTSNNNKYWWKNCTNLYKRTDQFVRIFRIVNSFFFFLIISKLNLYSFEKLGKNQTGLKLPFVSEILLS